MSGIPFGPSDAIIGIDVGNTTVKVIEAGDCTGVSGDLPLARTIHSIALSLPDWRVRVANLLRRASVQSDARGVQIRIASVNQSASSRLLADLNDLRESVRVITRRDIPLVVRTDAPERVGIDRLLGAWGAISRHPSPLMVVDAGTTVTIDYVDEDQIYRGGAILPGLQMQTRALAAGTDALPHLHWRGDDCCGTATLKEPGRNTLDAIRLGVFSSVVGAIERLHCVYGKPPTIVVTGGDAECLTPAITTPSTRVVQESQLVATTLLELH